MAKFTKEEKSALRGALAHMPIIFTDHSTDPGEDVTAFAERLEGMAGLVKEWVHQAEKREQAATQLRNDVLTY